MKYIYTKYIVSQKEKVSPGATLALFKAISFAFITAQFKKYKLNRDVKDTSKDKFDIGKVFNYVRTYTIPKLVEKFNCLRISCPCAEGDDVIAVTTKYILDQNEQNKVVIISSDRDLIQLCQDRVTLMTLDGTIREPKLDMEKILKKKIPDDVEFTAKEFIMIKILTGDKSDNIPNIMSGIGPVKAYNMVTEKDLVKLKTNLVIGITINLSLFS